MKHPPFFPLASSNKETAPQTLINIGPHHLLSIQQVVVPGPQPTANIYQICKRKHNLSIEINYNNKASEVKVSFSKLMLFYVFHFGCCSPRQQHLSSLTTPHPHRHAYENTEIQKLRKISFLSSSTHHLTPLGQAKAIQGCNSRDKI